MGAKKEARKVPGFIALRLAHIQLAGSLLAELFSLRHQNCLTLAPGSRIFQFGCRG